jgi:hypothetical protein
MKTICTTPRTPSHPVLFVGATERPLPTLAAMRNVTGEFAEHCTAGASGGVRLKTNGTYDVCPDVFVEECRAFCESKAVGKSGNAIVYQARLEKDVVWTAERGASLYYWFWYHRCNLTPLVGAYPWDVRQHFAGRLRGAAVLSLASLVAICASVKPKVLNKQYSQRGGRLGYGDLSKGYGIGYSVPRRAVQSLAIVRGVLPPREAAGVQLPPLPVRFDAESAQAFAGRFDSGTVFS